MSHGYVAVQWTRRKVLYDLILLLLVVAYVLAFLLVSQALAARAGTTLERDGVLIRAFGSAAFILLHVTVSIGPLSRFTPLAQRLLFNRRHMGVMVFGLALLHVHGWRWPDQPWALFGLRAPALPGGFYGALPWYNAFGNLDPLVSVLVGNRHYGDLLRFPFESLGLVAFLILFVMAATSHDFWLAHLTAPIWKAIHMGVYVAYAALVGHVLLGAVQSQRPPWFAVLLVVGLTWVVTLHLAAGWLEWRRDRQLERPLKDGVFDVGPLESIPDGAARLVMLAGERVAVFRDGEQVYALSNVCQHQNGPLGEGRLVNGCVICPWHGFEYEAATGASPPPFPERVPSFPVTVRDGRVLVGVPPRCQAQP